MTHSPYLKATLASVRDGIVFTDRQKAVFGMVVESNGTEYGCRELAAALAMHKVNITRTVDLLESHGYVTRTTRKDDRRLIIIAATAQGRDAWQRMAGLPRLGRRAA